MLAYVFWHCAALGVDASRYEERLAAFHRALRRSPSDGFVGSAAYRIQGAPWLPQAAGYEDWYEVEDWAALGALNAAAVSARVRADHDTVAHLAAGGAGGLYRLLRAAAEPAVHSGSLWFAKPRERSYIDFTAEVEALAAGCAVWQRQMVLGPATEFCLTGPEAQCRALTLPTQWQSRWVRRSPLF